VVVKAASVADLPAVSTLRSGTDLGIMGASTRPDAGRAHIPHPRRTVMKLYYSPGACSLASHIVLSEAGVKVELVKAALQTHTLADGTDFYQVTPKGQVPLLELDDGSRLSEGPVILQYIADHAPGAGLVPAAGTMERYRVMEWLNFVTSELHKGYSPLFNPKMPTEAKEIFVANLKNKYAFVDAKLEGKDYLMGKQFSIADAYLFTVTNWAPKVGLDLTGFRNLEAFDARMKARPAVRDALMNEGLMK
jgi:glutathione S-transferase